MCGRRPFPTFGSPVTAPHQVDEQRARPTSTLARHDLEHPDGRVLHLYGRRQGDLPDGLPARDPSARLHLRQEPLTGDWVAVSPARNTRPQTSPEAGDGTSADGAGRPACPLCPGGPEVPFGYDAAVFENRFPSLLGAPPALPHRAAQSPLERYRASLGRSEVVLYTEQHVGSLGTLTPIQVARVVAVWADRAAALWADPDLAYVLVFENRGEGVGATLSHPHGQIYAFDHLPPVIDRRHRRALAHRADHDRCLGCDVVDLDAGGARVIEAGGAFVVAVPFAARWPYEVHVRARRHGAGRLDDLDADERRDLARALQRVVRRYDGLFGFELPAMMVAHEAPRGQPDWHLSFEFLPPHRAPDKLKVRASVETATGLFINDTLPEDSAHALAAVPAGDDDWSGVVVPEVVAGAR